MRCLAILLLMAALGAGDTSLETTHGFRNGRWWKSTSQDVKVGFLIGYAEAATTEPGFKNRPSVADVAEGLDDFYGEPANASIPVWMALPIVALKFNGANKSTLEKETESARALAAGDLPSKR